MFILWHGFYFWIGYNGTSLLTDWQRVRHGARYGTGSWLVTGHFGF